MAALDALGLEVHFHARSCLGPEGDAITRAPRAVGPRLSCECAPMRPGQDRGATKTLRVSRVATPHLSTFPPPRAHALGRGRGGEAAGGRRLGALEIPAALAELTADGPLDVVLIVRAAPRGCGFRVVSGV